LSSVPDAIDRPAAFARSLDALRARLVETLEDLAGALDVTAQLAHAHAVRRTNDVDTSTRDTERLRAHRASKYAQLARINAHKVSVHPRFEPPTAPR
jgi:hypothetical protein